MTEKIRQLLFPGYFDPNRVRTEYAKFLVGERLEFIQYHLRKQVAKALGNSELCEECRRSAIVEKAENLVYEFLGAFPRYGNIWRRISRRLMTEIRPLTAPTRSYSAIRAYLPLPFTGSLMSCGFWASR